MPSLALRRRVGEDALVWWRALTATERAGWQARATVALYGKDAERASVADTIEWSYPRRSIAAAPGSRKDN